jgi:hypothetical protein
MGPDEDFVVAAAGFICTRLRNELTVIETSYFSSHVLNFRLNLIIVCVAFSLPASRTKSCDGSTTGSPLMLWMGMCRSWNETERRETI